MLRIGEGTNNPVVSCRVFSNDTDVVDADGTSVHKITVNVPPLQMPLGASQQSELGVVAHLQVRLSPRKFGPYTAAIYADTASVKQIGFSIVPQQKPA